MQFVTFKIDDHLLGTDIKQVREINRMLDITPVPLARAHVRGLVNMRGQIVTVFDLGIKLGLPAREISQHTHNVILKSDMVGLLVDEIGDVVQAEAQDMEPPPANLGGLPAKFIEAVVKLKDRLLVVLSMEKVLR